MTLRRGQVQPSAQLARYLGGLRRRAGLSLRALSERAAFHESRLCRATGTVVPSWQVTWAFAAECEKEIRVRAARRGDRSEIVGLLSESELKELWSAAKRGERR